MFTAFPPVTFLPFTLYLFTVMHQLFSCLNSILFTSDVPTVGLGTSQIVLRDNHRQREASAVVTYAVQVSTDLGRRSVFDWRNDGISDYAVQ